MKKDIQLLIEKIKQTYKRKKVWTYIVGILSCIAIFATIYSLMMPASAYTRVEEPNEFRLYKITLKDSFQGTIKDDAGNITKDYTWKEKYYTNTSPNYELDLYYEDTTGSLIKGKNITIEVGPNKLEDKIYRRHTGYIGNMKETQAKDMDPNNMLMLAVKGMLPKNSLGRQMLTKLKVYKGAEHKNQAQKPEELKLF